MVIVNWLPV